MRQPVLVLCARVADLWYGCTEGHSCKSLLIQTIDLNEQKQNPDEDYEILYYTAHITQINS